METVEDTPKGRDHDFICKLISEYFSQKVMQNLEDIMDDRKRAVQEAVQDAEYESASEEEGESHAMAEQEFRQQQRKRDLDRRQKELAKWEFPSKIGSYNEYTVPALEYSKMLCNHVFGLDPAF